MLRGEMFGLTVGRERSQHGSFPLLGVQDVEVQLLWSSGFAGERGERGGGGGRVGRAPVRRRRP